ncbi:MAG TPA: hypothetical protein VES91_02705 [Burkholderiaceae bacterium]|nr:hypothetical protein [Burkholderiaceae bacterium]
MRAILTDLLLAPIVALAQPAASAAKNSAPAKSSKVDEHRNEDVARHRQMAKAHEEAARCLEAGTAEKQCHEQLRNACKGIAVGQYCGMRHAH